MFMLAASEIARQVDTTFWIVTGIGTVICLGITVVMLAFIWKYHRSKRDTIEQIDGHHKLEVAWTVIPVFIVMYIFYLGAEDFFAIREVPDDQDIMQVNVTGKKWDWTFYYPEHGITTTNKLYLPKGKAVKFNLAAQDVLHSFYIPAFMLKEDCVPGVDTYMWFIPEEEGEYNIFCAEYCGGGHSDMIGSLYVFTEKQFELWVEQEIERSRQPVDLTVAVDPDSEKMQSISGQEIYQNYCVVCHGENGKGGGAVAARDFTQPEGWVNGPKVTGIFRTLTEGIAGTQMASFSNLSSWQRFAVSHYVRKFAEFDLPETTKEDIQKLRQDYPNLESGRVNNKPKIPIEEAMKKLISQKNKDKQQQGR